MLALGLGIAFRDKPVEQVTVGLAEWGAPAEGAGAVLATMALPD